MKNIIKIKKGISLIVLVITIIVMIILATTVILSLNSTNIINSANEAVNETNLKQVQNIANMAWIDSYLSDKKSQAELETAVENALLANKVDKNKYDVEVREKGVSVFEICEENILNKLEGHLMTRLGEDDAFFYKYNFLENKQLESIVVSDGSEVLGELNAKNNWQADVIITPISKMVFGKNDEFNTQENMLYFVSEFKTTSPAAIFLSFKFKFTDGTVATDRGTLSFQSDEPARLE